MKLTRRDFLKVSLGGAVSLSASMLLAGCGSGGSEKQTGHTKIKVGVSGDPKSLAPYALGNDARKMICFHIYQAAMHLLKAGDTPIPAICESYEMDMDGATVTVKLRDGIHDHDGNPFTASDLAYSYNTTKEVANSASYDYFTEVKAIDEKTAVIYYNPTDIVKRNNVESALAQGGVYMFTQAAWEASEDAMVATPVGTGPYRVSSFSVGAKVILEKVEDFWQAEAGYEVPRDYQANFDEIEISVITEVSQIAIALETGDIDASANVSEQDITLFQEGGEHADDFKVVKNEGFLGYFMTFNAHTELGGNINIRKAICHAVDLDGMINTLAKGEAVRMNAPYGTASSAGDYDPKWDEREYFPFSMDTAKEYLDKYLAESGKKAEDVVVKFAVQNNANCPKPAEILQAKLLELGIGVDMKVYDPATFNTILTEEDSYDFTMYCMGWNGVVNAWQLNDSSNYYYHFDKESAMYQELLSYTEPCMSRVTWTQEATEKLWQYVYDNAWVRGLYKNYDNIVVPKWVNEVVINFNRNCMYGSFVHD